MARRRRDPGAPGRWASLCREFLAGESLAPAPAWQGARVAWANRALLALGPAIRRSPVGRALPATLKIEGLRFL